MKKLISIAIFFVVWALFWAAPLLFNGTNTQYLPTPDYGYSIVDYDVDIVVDEDKTMHITEKITADFESPSHGIKRYLPVNQTVSFFDENDKQVSISYRNEISNFKYHSGSSSLRTGLVDVEDQYGYRFFYLGNANSYSLGERTYCFSYDFNSGDDRIADKDLFYFNVIGTGWDTSIKNVDFSITFPTEIESLGFEFYVGQYGVDQENGDQRLTYSIIGNKIEGSVVQLSYGEALTIYNEFQEGYFDVEKGFVYDIVLLIIVLVVLAAILIFFIVKRRKLPIVEVVEFSAPNGLTPAEVGYINDGKLTGDEISALIVYWASKGYVKLKQITDKSVKIIKIREMPNNAKEHEKLFFASLFSGKTEVLSNDLGITDISLGSEIKKSVEKSTKNCFDKVSDWLYNLMPFLIMVAYGFMLYKEYRFACVGGVKLFGEIVALCAICAGLLILPICLKNSEKWSKRKGVIMLVLNLTFVLAGVLTLMFLIEPYGDRFGARFYIAILPFVCAFICPKIERYTNEGREHLGHIRGLKNYILVAEKDRIAVLAKENPELFFEILPYAYVLGVSDEYMKMFEDVAIVQPEWYECDTWTSVYFAMHTFRWLNVVGAGLRNVMIRHSVVKALSTISSVSRSSGGGSSGGGGGGFSGGGSGGGGGGRW